MTIMKNNIERRKALKRKQILAGLLTMAMVGTSLALPGNTLQAEAAPKAVKKITIPKKATVYIGVKKTLKVTKAPKAASAKSPGRVPTRRSHP